MYCLKGKENGVQTGASGEQEGGRENVKVCHSIVVS